MLRRYWLTDTIDEDAVYEASALYGEYDGSISYQYTMAFTEIYQSLTDAQKLGMEALRDELVAGYECADGEAYIYSTEGSLPSFEDTDFLFGEIAAESPESTESAGCQEILQLEGGSGSSEFVNGLDWIRIEEVLEDADYYFISTSSWSTYYLYYLQDCKDSDWWLISEGFPDLNGFPCDAAVGRCKRSELAECDGNWAFKASQGNGHDPSPNVEILSMGCQ